MKIVIAGDGELGYHVAKFLIKENHSITIIDKDQFLLKAFESYNEVLTIEGASTSATVLKEAGIENADILVSVLHDENINITTCILGKSLGVKRTIARIDNVEFLDLKNQAVFKNLGVDALVCPEKIAANEIIKLIKQAAATEIIDFSDGLLSLFLLKLDSKSLVINKSLEQVARENPDIHFRAVAIHRNSSTIIPSGKDVFMENDMAYVITQPDDIDRLLKLSGKVNFRITKIIIAGGSRIGRKSATVLQNYKNVTIIDKNDERIEQLSDILTKSLIVKGDIRNIDLLLEEGIETTDAFIAVTNSSETNILTSLLAKKFNVPRIITLVENIEFIDIAQKVGLDAIINKKIITASYITNFILSEKVSTLKYLTGVDAEALELIVKPNAPVTKKPIFELDFPHDAIIGGYIRNGRGFIALGNSQIKAGDKVVVFVMPKDAEEVMSFFE